MSLPDLEDAISHLEEQEVDAAISVLREKLKALPAHLTAHVLLARAYEAKGDWSSALTCWENVRLLMPSSPVGQEGKERVLRELDQDDADASSPSPESSDESSESSSPTSVSPEQDEPSSPEAASTAEDILPSDVDAAANAPSAPSDSSSDQDDAEDERTGLDAHFGDDAPSPSDTESGLAQLRQQAEEEARRGGARPGLTDPADADDTPEDRIDQIEAEDEDLDDLIDQLESARIDPDPDVDDDVPQPDLDDDVEDIVSETLARIHESQGDYRRAARIYIKLAGRDPDNIRTYLEKASEMREKAEAQDNDPENEDAPDQ